MSTGKQVKTCVEIATTIRNKCNIYRPAKGGTDCVGENVSYDLCNKRPCPTSRDFRADQCLYRNNEVEFNNQRHTWLPYEPLASKTQNSVSLLSFIQRQDQIHV